MVRRRATNSFLRPPRGRWLIASASRAVHRRGSPSSRQQSRTTPLRLCCRKTASPSHGWPPSRPSTPGSGSTVRHQPRQLRVSFWHTFHLCHLYTCNNFGKSSNDNSMVSAKQNDIVYCLGTCYSRVSCCLGVLFGIFVLLYMSTNKFDLI